MRSKGKLGYLGRRFWNSQAHLGKLGTGRNTRVTVVDRRASLWFRSMKRLIFMQVSKDQLSGCVDGETFRVTLGEDRSMLAGMSGPRFEIKKLEMERVGSLRFDGKFLMKYGQR